MIDEKWIAVMLIKFLAGGASPFVMSDDDEMVRSLFYNSGAMDLAQYLIANLEMGDA